MKNSSITLLSVLGLFMAYNAQAHSRWIVPSHTILSGKKAEAVSFDVSVSNDIFHADRAFGGKSMAELPQVVDTRPKNGRSRPEVKLQATLPDGKVVKDLPLVQAGRKSVASYVLEQNGSYRFSLVQDKTKMTVYETAEGKPARQFGEFASAKDLPKGSKNIRHVQSSSRVETFVSRNGQGGSALQPLREGLDLTITPHPNELFVGETSEIQLYVDGKALGKDVKITITPDGTRYRNDRAVIQLSTNDKGIATIKWPQAGLYLLEIEHTIAGEGHREERLSLFVTLEVNPS